MRQTEIQTHTQPHFLQCVGKDRLCVSRIKIMREHVSKTPLRAA